MLIQLAKLLEVSGLFFQNFAVRKNSLTDKFIKKIVPLQRFPRYQRCIGSSSDPGFPKGWIRILSSYLYLMITQSMVHTCKRKVKDKKNFQISSKIEFFLLYLLKQYEIIDNFKYFSFFSSSFGNTILRRNLIGSSQSQPGSVTWDAQQSKQAITQSSVSRCVGMARISGQISNKTPDIWQIGYIYRKYLHDTIVMV